MAQVSATDDTAVAAPAAGATAVVDDDDDDDGGGGDVDKATCFANRCCRSASWLGNERSQSRHRHTATDEEDPIGTQAAMLTVVIDGA